MIKFFSKIRQQLLGEGKTDKAFTAGFNACEIYPASGVFFPAGYIEWPLV